MTPVRALSLVLSGMHLMITGSSGVGKTSVARMLVRLWAVLSGTKHSKRGQTSIMSSGTRKINAFFLEIGIANLAVVDASAALAKAKKKNKKGRAPFCVRST